MEVRTQVVGSMKSAKVSLVRLRQSINEFPESWSNDHLFNLAVVKEGQYTWNSCAAIKYYLIAQTIVCDRDLLGPKLVLMKQRLIPQVLRTVLFTAVQEIENTRRNAEVI